ncbi:phenylacetate--CoA ligase family protein [Actinomycetospora cinnamomea]|uniref:Phenylacetate-coenzyme A ligase PaaK-like adenylate-forming protein n=1 Tax=Actinomycetospora cinnamomea TaxID=663609 RepID=A0A2U1FFH3_9PSEU|nr:phenylacetate--CoA ligase family protein [Actinomycetospora cinnamomea]PVZ10918.1 phenylacetate-coenzyme A ligase PaaK-like adenylate-forming protein [Actinomycetospora cinnamomea]
MRRRELTAAGVAWDAWRAVRGGPPAIAARRAARLDAVVRHARRASPFYAEHYRALPDGPVDLVRLPPVRKPGLMARFDDWVTDPAVTRTGVEAFVGDPGRVGEDFLGRYVVFTTSGSTAEPALLVQDPRAVAVMTGLTYARSAGVLPPRLLLRVLARGARQAAVFAPGGHYLSATMFERRLRARPVRRRWARYFSVLDPLPQLVAQLDEFQPVLLGTYASALGVLADEQEAGRLHISPLVISSGGEALTPTVRRRAERVFGAVVVDTYNASEATPLSLPCRRGRMHVNADWFVVEPVDAEGAPVPDGQRSETVLVTNLANHVQPIIRYELGDSVVVGAEPCPCGSPLPTITAEGRTDEILRIPGADDAEVALLPMAVATVVEETPGVRGYQVVQTAPATLALRLDVDPGARRDEVGQRARDRLDEYLRTQGAAPGVAIELADDPPRPHPRSGKLRHVLRSLPPSPLG